MKETEPQNAQNYIFIANHNKWLDSWLVWAAIEKSNHQRAIRPMMADGLAKTPLGLLLRLAGGFPANAGKGLEEALQVPQKLLSEGNSILIYPHGAPKNGHRETKPGARELSRRTGIPIVPMLVDSSALNFRQIFLEKRVVSVTVGNPFIPNPNEDVMTRVWELKNTNQAQEIRLNTGISTISNLVKAPLINVKRIHTSK